MYSFRKSLVALFGLLFLVAAIAALLPLVGQGQAGDQNPLRRDPRKSFYMTRTEHNGAQAPTACAAGYHMASLWEIFDTSNLRYNTELGFTQADSGFGPPKGLSGWVRTGGGPNSSSLEPGLANCDAYESASGSATGTGVNLASSWFNTGSVISPWVGGVISCDAAFPVWCMQD